MKFLVDAQLPRRMTAWLTTAGCDAVHTLDDFLAAWATAGHRGVRAWTP